MALKMKTGMVLFWQDTVLFTRLQDRHYSDKIFKKDGVMLREYPVIFNDKPSSISALHGLDNPSAGQYFQDGNREAIGR